eukprot:5945874-Pleurochrysis_carterae.AAC.1
MVMVMMMVMVMVMVMVMRMRGASRLLAGLVRRRHRGAGALCSRGRALKFGSRASRSAQIRAKADHTQSVAERHCRSDWPLRASSSGSIRTVAQAKAMEANVLGTWACCQLKHVRTSCMLLKRLICKHTP